MNITDIQRRYAAEFALAETFGPTECVDHGGGAVVFWTSLNNGVAAAASTAEMGGVYENGWSVLVYAPDTSPEIVLITGDDLSRQLFYAAALTRAEIDALIETMDAPRWQVPQIALESRPEYPDPGLLAAAGSATAPRASTESVTTRAAGPDPLPGITDADADTGTGI
jgi:hypothetical protein